MLGLVIMLIAVVGFATIFGVAAVANLLVGPYAAACITGVWGFAVCYAYSTWLERGR